MSEPAPEQAAEQTPAPASDDHAQRIQALDYDGCPKCTTGTLRVVGFDPTAEHESLQGNVAVPFIASGGAVHRHCFLCGYHESEPIGKLEGEGETNGGA